MQPSWTSTTALLVAGVSICALAADSSRSLASQSVTLTDSGLVVVELKDTATVPANLFDHDNSTLRFTPSGDGYARTVLTSQYNAAIGSRLLEHSYSANAFRFGFSGKERSEFFIDTGLITFSSGDAESLVSDVRFRPITEIVTRFVDSVPSIAPLYKPRLSGDRFVHELSDRLVITWMATEPWGGIFDFIEEANSNVYQAVLYADGKIDLNYQDIAIEDGIVGVFPSRTEAIQSAMDPAQVSSEAFHYRSIPSYTDLICDVTNSVGDVFDFFVFYSQFRMDEQEAGSPVANFNADTDGIGSPLYPTLPCGGARLKSALVLPIFIDSNQARGLGPVGIDDEFNFSMSQLGHELAHRWLVSAKALVGGTITDLGDGGHWIQNLHAPAAHPWIETTQASAMGGGHWADNGDGTFTRLADAFFVPASGFSFLDLYLMGFLAPGDVRDFFLIDNLLFSHSNAQNQPVYTGDRVDLSINDIVAALGARSPSVADSQKSFNTAFVYLLEPGTTAIQEKTDRLDAIRTRFSEYWSFVTNGVSAMSSTPTPTPTPTDCTFTLDTTTVNIPAAGVSVGAVDVTASGSTCGWEAVSNSAFITVLDINVAFTAPGGSGRVLYSVAANTGAARTGTMTLAGQTVTVNQAGTTGGGGPVISRAYFPDPSANSWVFRTEFSGGVPPYTLFYSRVQNGGFLGSFPMTGPPAWEAFVNCSLQPGATQHGPAIQAGGRWWVVVQDGAGRSSASTVVEGTPSSTHPACQ